MSYPTAWSPSLMSVPVSYDTPYGPAMSPAVSWVYAKSDNAAKVTAELATLERIRMALLVRDELRRRQHERDGAGD